MQKNIVWKYAKTKPIPNLNTHINIYVESLWEGAKVFFNVLNSEKIQMQGYEADGALLILGPFSLNTLAITL